MLGKIFRRLGVWMIAKKKLHPQQPLDRSSSLVSKKVWNSKIQWSDQKLWLSKVFGASIDASSQFS